MVKPSPALVMKGRLFDADCRGFLTIAVVTLFALRARKWL
jgi:hypothetical protein